MTNLSLIKPNRLATLSNVGVAHNDQWLVRGVDLSIDPGEIVTLIGPNGSGKSTSAKVLLGLIKPDEGSVSRLADLKVGYVPQKLSIDWSLPLSVKRLMSLTGKVADKDCQDALESVGAGHLINSEVQHLSGGEFQRVLLARAIAKKPDLLVLDEPVQGVDFTGELELYELINDIRNRLGCGVLLISHDLHVVMAATDTVVCLNGHVCCRGTPQSVTQSPEFHKLFGNRGASALAIYKHRHDHKHLDDGRVLHADGSITNHCEPATPSLDGHHHDHTSAKGLPHA